MRTPWPTAWPAFSSLKVRAYPFDMVTSCLWFLYRSDPADPFIARKRREAVPQLQRHRVGNEAFSQICRHTMHGSCGDLFLDHSCIITESTSITLKSWKQQNLDFAGNFGTNLLPVPGAHLMKPGIVDNLDAGAGPIPIQDAHGSHEAIAHIFAEGNTLQKDRLGANAAGCVFVATANGVTWPNKWTFGLQALITAATAWEPPPG
jgi:hypothetical protein